MRACANRTGFFVPALLKKSGLCFDLIGYKKLWNKKH